jgi:hypothetical protein
VRACVEERDSNDTAKIERNQNAAIVPHTCCLNTREDTCERVVAIDQYSLREYSLQNGICETKISMSDNHHHGHDANSRKYGGMVDVAIRGTSCFTAVVVVDCAMYSENACMNEDGACDDGVANKAD